MFSSSKPNPKGSLLSLQTPLADPKQQKGKKQKPPTREEQYQMALVTAKVFLEESNARMQKPMNRFNEVANSNYWYYGYFGGSMALTMAACIAIGTRVSFFQRYSGWIALLGGFGGSKVCLSVHTAYLMQDVVKQIDHEIGEATRMDEQSNHMLSEYMAEVDRLKHVKYTLVPHLPEAIEDRQRRQSMTLEDRADAIAEAYMKRKEALSKKD